MKWLMDRAALWASGVLIFSTSMAFASEPEAVPGEYLVKLRPAFASVKSDFQALSRELGMYVKSSLSDSPWVLVQGASFEQSSFALKSLSQNEMVEAAEPNFIYRTSRKSDDPMLEQLWGLINFGQADSTGAAGVSGVDIGIEKAWDIQTGSRKIVVAVIDTGLDYILPDLAANAWTNDAEKNGQAGVDDDGNGVVDDIYGYNAVTNSGDPKDDHGHGSHCSGTIGGRGNDGVGLVGVNWDVRLMGVKFLTAGGSGTLADAVKAIDYATKMGANVLSNSWGGGGVSQALKESIERANAKGVLFVAAAGNDGSNNDAVPSYPASYEVPNVLSVAAINNKGELAYFSNFGKRSVHVGAPGVNVVSSTPAGYKSWSGTSMATPHVSGIAALLLAQEPGITHLEVRERLIKTAKPISGLRGKVASNGLVDAYNVLTNTIAPPDPNDPANWQYVNATASTVHPYQANGVEEFEISVPGASEMALYFSKFDTERGFDFVELYDRAGALVTKLSGTNDDSHSPTVRGDYIRVKIKADDSVQKYGFDITRVYFR